MTDVNDKQVGGDHYKRAKFQPWDWNKYGVGGLEWTAIKYITRYKYKHGAQDLEKAKHFMEKAASEFVINGLTNRARMRPMAELKNAMSEFSAQNCLSALQHVAVWNIINWHNELSFKLTLIAIEDIIKSLPEERL